MVPPIVMTIPEIRAVTDAVRQQGQTIGFVPTMGALHEGHASLIRAARAASDYVVVSIFVNPTQFGPHEDYAKYPRTLEADQLVCAQAGADVIFAPRVEDMYPANSFSYVEVAKLGDHLCGRSRPGHFRGVCTVVMKLFNIIRPDVAYFGAKDYQQARIITQMVRDLNVPVRIAIEPTVREADGLALSSRNRYLSPAERAVAPRIQQALQTIAQRVAAGEVDTARLESALEAELMAIPGTRVDYAKIVDAEFLQPLTRIDRPAVIAVAVFLGTTRLIDNLLIGEPVGR
ncbi:MAG: pantoate--beta-alanine ligase [Gemmataceae bacterium]|nr:pantoate--beta-alanine ligase [Gemmata sp.]MDW8198954.1 pantoate--beta-alanine ligase [Gemmataceae bacterium]